MRQLIDSSWNHSNQRLKGSFSMALLLHLALLLGLGFSASPIINPTTSMDVTLAQYASDNEPDEADFLAQTNQQGSGDRGSELEASLNSQSVFEASEQGGTPAVQNLAEQAAGNSLLTRQTTEISFNWLEKIADVSMDDPQPLPTELSVGAMRAKLDKLQQAYSKLPKVSRLTSASTKNADEAAYMHYFEQQIELVGNLNYPREAKARQLSGMVHLVVVIVPDGTVKKISIAGRSGSRILDQAAVRSVRHASPFRPFPPELRDHDEIHIIRTWQYQANQLSTSR
jgi:protein TonB